MIFKAALTTKINPPFTINVPSSFAKAGESGYIQPHERNSFHRRRPADPRRRGAAWFGVLALVLLLAIAIVIARSGRRGRNWRWRRRSRRRTGGAPGEMLRIAERDPGRVDAMAQALVGAAVEMTRAVNERLDAVTHRGRPVDGSDHAPHHGQPAQLHERLAVIDSAQKNITDLASQVTSLRDVLANKQARGAFGQGRMEAIVQDGLPQGLLRVPVHAVERQAAGLRGVPAATSGRCDRREISAGSDHRAARRAQRRRAQAPPSACART